METPLDNPVIRDDDELDSKFLEAAALADQGEDIPSDLVPGATAESPTATETKEEKPGGEQQPDNSETDPDKKKDDRPRDELGRFTKTETGEDIPESERQPTEQQPSDYEAKKQEKKQKEQERLDKTWENVNRQKDELAAREKALAEQAQAVQQQMQQRQQVQQPERRYSSQALFEASQDFKARAGESIKRYQETGNDADLDAFNENTALAEKAEEHARQFYQIEAREVQQAQVEQYKRVWDSNMEKAVQADPDIIKSDSPLAKAVHSLLETHGDVFWMIPDGFPKAVEIAKLRLEAGSASELRDANKKLQAEVDRLNGEMAISGGGVTSQPAKPKFEDMSDDEQTAYLLRGAQAADNGQLT